MSTLTENNTAVAPAPFFATDLHLDPQVITFLKGLNNGGPGLETLTPVQARQVLVGAAGAGRRAGFGQRGPVGH
jgi:hypothetical protein